MSNVFVNRKNKRVYVQCSASDANHSVCIPGRLGILFSFQNLIVHNKQYNVEDVENIRPLRYIYYYYYYFPSTRQLFRSLCIHRYTILRYKYAPVRRFFSQNGIIPRDIILRALKITEVIIRSVEQYFNHSRSYITRIL